MIKYCRSSAAAWMLISAVCAAAVVVLTLTPGRNLIIALIQSVIDQVWWGDLLGHSALMGAFTAIVYAALRIGCQRRFSHALAAALIITLTLSVITEVLQQFTPGRSPDRADFTANLLGACAAAALICYRRARQVINTDEQGV